VSTRINTPHDRFFKTMMAIPDVNREFLIANLPSDILDLIDLDTIKFHKESFIDQQLKLNMVDILVETKFNDIPGYIYVLAEHQSKPDKLMPLRIWLYMLKIMEYHTTQNKTKELPTVYPIIFYNGKKQYSYSTNLLDLFTNKELAKRILGLLAPIQLTALNQIVDDELKELINYCSLALTMKHIYDKDTGALLKIILQSTQRISNHVIAANAITYFTETRKIDIQDFRRIIDESDLPKDYKEEAMTLADTLRQEGRQEGIQKGRQEGIQEGMQKGQSKLIKNLLATGMSIEQIAMAANLTTDEVEQLAIVDM